MAKVVRKSAEELVKQLLEKQQERIKKIQQRDKAKLRKLQAKLRKEKDENRTLLGTAIEALYKASGANLDIKAVLSLCEKYIPREGGKGKEERLA